MNLKVEACGRRECRDWWRLVASSSLQNNNFLINKVLAGLWPRALIYRCTEVRSTDPSVRSTEPAPITHSWSLTLARKFCINWPSMVRSTEPFYRSTEQGFSLFAEICRDHPLMLIKCWLDRSTDPLVRSTDQPFFPLLADRVWCTGCAESPRFSRPILLFDRPIKLWLASVYFGLIWNTALITSVSVDRSSGSVDQSSLTCKTVLEQKHPAT